MYNCDQTAEYGPGLLLISGSRLCLGERKNSGKPISKRRTDAVHSLTGPNSIILSTLSSKIAREPRDVHGSTVSHNHAARTTRLHCKLKCKAGPQSPCTGASRRVLCSLELLLTIVSTVVLVLVVLVVRTASVTS